MLAQWLMRKRIRFILTKARPNLMHPPSRMSTSAIGIYDKASLDRNGTWHDDIMMGLLEHEFQSR